MQNKRRNKNSALTPSTPLLTPLLVIFILITIIFIQTIETKQTTRYKRWEKEEIIPKEGNKTQTTNNKPIRVVIAAPYRSILLPHLNWIIEGVLQKVNQPIIWEFEEVNLHHWRVNNSIIITAGSLDAYFDELEGEKANLKIGVIHLYDTYCPSQKEVINHHQNRFYSKAKFVLRNHYCENYHRHHSNVFHLPLGWRNEPDLLMLNFFNDLSIQFVPTSIEKINDFAFIGTSSVNRSQIESIIEGYDIRKYQYIYHYHYNSIKLIKTESSWVPREVYNYNLMSSHIGLVVDTLTPPSIESPRFYEVISHGAIPLSLWGDYLKVFDYKFPVLKNWRRDLAGTLEKYLENDHAEAIMEQRKILFWWREYLHQLRLVVSNLVDELF